VEGVCVSDVDVAGGVGREGINVGRVPEVELDIAPSDDEVSVPLDRRTNQVEPEPGVKRECLF
jgi:hypothetical protein